MSHAGCHSGASWARVSTGEECRGHGEYLPIDQVPRSPKTETLAMLRLGMPPRLCVSPMDGPWPGAAAKLALARAPEQLQVDLVRHAQAAGADRMAEALETAVDLAGDGAVPVVAAIEYIVRRPADVGQSEILHQHELGDREAVVHLDQIDLLARVCGCRLPRRRAAPRGAWSAYACRPRIGGPSPRRCWARAAAPARTPGRACRGCARWRVW